MVPRRNAAQIDHLGLDAHRLQGFRHAGTKPNRVAPANQRQFAAAPDLAGRADRHELTIDVGRRGEIGIVQQALWIQEHGRTLGLKRRVQESGRVAGVRRHEHVQTRRVRDHRLERLSMVRSQSRAIAAAGDHHDDRRVDLAAGTPEQGGQFGSQLVEPRRQEIGELDEGHRPLSRHGPAERHAQDRGLGQRRIQNSPGKFGAQPLGDAEHVAFGVFDVFAEQNDARIHPQPVAQHRPHRIAHDQLQPFVRTSLLAGRMGQFNPQRLLGIEHRFRFRAGCRGFFVRRQFPLDVLMNRGQFVLRPAVVQHPCSKPLDRVAQAAAGFDFVAVAVDRLIVGVGVAGQPLDIHHDQRRASRRTDVGDHLAESRIRFHGIASVDVLDRQPPKRIRTPVGQRVERPARRRRRDRVAVVLHDQQQRQMAAHRFSARFQKLALLGCAVADAAIDQRPGRIVADRGGHAAPLQSVVADRGHHAQNVQLRIAAKPAHLPAARAGTVLAVQIVEKRPGPDSPRQQQRPVAVVAVQPIVRRQVQSQGCGGFVPAARHREESFTPVGDLVLKLVHSPGHEHGAIQSLLVFPIHDSDLTGDGGANWPTAICSGN